MRFEVVEQFKIAVSKFAKYPGDKKFTTNFPLISARIIELTQSCPKSLLLRARLALLERGLDSPPLCPICGKLVKWVTTDIPRWSDTCSMPCSVKLYWNKNKPLQLEIRKQTCIQNYGVEHPMQLQEVLDKRKETFLKNWGTEHYLQSEIGKENWVDSFRTKHGVDNPMFLQQNLDKCKETSLKNYGVEHPSRSLVVKEKRRFTLVKNYGVEHPMQAKVVKDKFLRTIKVRNPKDRSKISAKFKATCIKKYGAENVMQVKEIFAKSIATCRKNWGVDRPLQSKEIRRKMMLTNVLRYEVPNVIQNPNIKAKMIKSLNNFELRKRLTEQRRNLYPGQCFTTHSSEILTKLNNRNFWIEEYEHKYKSVTQIAYELGISQPNASYYFRLHNIEKRNNWLEETILANFIANFIEIECKVKLERKELDVYIPSKNLAFEYNGLYYHQESFKQLKSKDLTSDLMASDYHLFKTLLCEKHRIRLVHVWEDDWLLNIELMKRKIKALLGLEDKKVFARKCKIIIPSQEQKQKFYMLNHIKGLGPDGRLSYALKFENEIVAMMTFRLTQHGWDLNRFATSCSVPGGFSKLLEHFKRNNSWEKIYTFADRSWSQGNVYLKNGFKLVEEQYPTFYGVEKGCRINRLNYTHGKLTKRFPDLKGTQFQIMDQAGIRRVWDCGQLKFELSKEKEYSAPKKLRWTEEEIEAWAQIEEELC